jgi:hypothetical protein
MINLYTGKSGNPHIPETLKLPEAHTFTIIANTADIASLKTIFSSAITIKYKGDYDFNVTVPKNLVTTFLQYCDENYICICI